MEESMEISKKDRPIIEWAMYLFPEAVGLMVCAIVSERDLELVDLNRVELTIQDEEGFLHYQCKAGEPLYAFMSIRISALQYLLHVCLKNLSFPTACDKLRVLKEQFDATIKLLF